MAGDAEIRPEPETSGHRLMVSPDVVAGDPRRERTACGRQPVCPQQQTQRRHDVAMPGRDTFTAEEAETIRALLTDLRRADRPRQKLIRSQLRRLGFRISDFTAAGSPMTYADFDSLVVTGRIRIEAPSRQVADAGDPRSSVLGSLNAQTAKRRAPSAASAPSTEPIIDRLLAMKPVPASVAEPPDDAHGVYAWWTTVQVLPGVPLRPHRTGDGLGLAYVGIADPDSLYGRMVGHLDGSTGSSTLRKSVAAVLWKAEGWERQWTPGTDETKPRVVLIPPFNDGWSVILRDQFFVTWSVHPSPKAVEKTVIRSLRPPLNDRHNAGHPFLRTLRDLRGELSRRPG